jgi:uncharacterized membrane protein HdeD (DUF308 family)
MAFGLPAALSAVVESEIAALRRNWGWLLAGGIALVVLGMGALLLPAAATIATIKVLGVFMLLAAGAEFATAFFMRGWGGVLTAILCGVMYFFAGVIIVSHPANAAAIFTLFLTMMFVALGAIRIAVGVVYRHSGWGWTVFSGIITLILAMMIWQDFPQSSLWVIGTFLGIDFIFHGWSWIILALTIKKLPRFDEPQTPANQTV